MERFLDLNMDWLDEGSNEEREVLTIDRQTYHLTERATVNNWNDTEFFIRFKMSKGTFMVVLDLITPALQYPQLRSRYVTPEQQLLITLRFLASGSMQVTVADVINVSQSTVSQLVVCDALLHHFHNFIKMPQTIEERQQATTEFYNFAEFPRTIGAIDCSHAKIQSPGGRLGEGYRNRKGYFSLNVQTISSANLKVINIVSRWPGATHDQTIFRQSLIRENFEAGDFGQYILVGDSGYANTFYFCTPFTANNREIDRDVHMKAYQAAIIRTRNVVERQYGVMRRRFPALAYGLRVHVELSQKLISIAAMLHNICIDFNELHPPIDVDTERILTDEANVGEADENSIGNRPAESQPRRHRNARDEILEIYRSSI